MLPNRVQYILQVQDYIYTYNDGIITVKQIITYIRLAYK